ncbi:segregation and condensation protein A [Eupransor demetentiae]|uniref:Segregation and condensation protein A n=1 Tax=Eupransor demetentiae TaxID=3109584 RepID=A0ABP0ER85_9LACO|nr:Chromatin segregation and condensation protein Rec8/ScpA/Scc1 [Lactobacillaceae bacterium LMG 33000]
MHLIKKNEMNIFDLPIAEITKQYLGFIRQQQTIELDIASEYLVMAATLIYLKSVDLLPKEEDSEEAEDDYVDPKEELIERLINYQRYQMASQFFEAQQEKGQQSFVRPPQVPADERSKNYQLSPGLSLVDLQLAFENVLARRRDLAPQAKQIQAENYTINDGIHYLRGRLEHLQKGESITFDQLLDGLHSRDQLVMGFLGLLELAKSGDLQLWQADRQQSILVKMVKDE